jgi:hypothetical protein
MTWLGVAAWASVAAMVAGLLWAGFNWRRRGRVLAGIGVALLAVVSLVLVWFAVTGAFCVAPPGSGCA